MCDNSAANPTALDDHFSRINAQYGAQFSFGSCFNLNPTYSRQQEAILGENGSNKINE